jgi:hypothetical protein
MKPIPKSACLLAHTSLRGIIAVVLVGLAQLADARALPAIVGEATMVIGVARIVSDDGLPKIMERGAVIHEGDRLETDVGGHIHLRFVDGGRISLRPSSRLQIENYSHSEHQPTLNAIKFRLDEGVVRSITGRWGEVARDRFRLNTPVAAIGVKGTDFIVTSDTNKTLASVYTGAIILSPLADECQATLGPCQNGREKLLSASMVGQMIALYRQETTPHIVSIPDSMAQYQGRGTEKSLRSDTGRPDDRTDRSVLSESRTASVTTELSALQQPFQPIQPEPPQVKQLEWVRFPWVQPMDGDTLTAAFEQANRSGRQGVVGNGAYGLYRDLSGNNTLQTTEASANFRLASGVGRLSMAQGRTTESLKIESGTLSVDFARATFNTQLNVSNPTIGTDKLNASGMISPSGVMRGLSGNANVAGALTLDGKEAGYFFDKTLPVGNISGITLWGR